MNTSIFRLYALFVVLLLAARVLATDGSPSLVRPIPGRR